MITVNLPLFPSLVFDSPDSCRRRGTILFGIDSNGVVSSEGDGTGDGQGFVSGENGQLARTSDMVWPNNEMGGAFCERSRIWFPAGMLVKDSTGRVVGTPYEVRDRGYGR